MTVQPPPVYEKLANEDAKATMPWVLFFNQIYDGDSGTIWEPTFTNLTTVGAPEITGRTFRLSKHLTYFHVNITPATSTTAVAGSTYISNFPLKMMNDGACLVVSGGAGSIGHTIAATNRIYVPAWSAITVPLTVLGIVEAY